MLIFILHKKYLNIPIIALSDLGQEGKQSGFLGIFENQGRLVARNAVQFPHYTR